MVSCYFRMTRNNPSSEYLSKNVNCIINLGSKRMRKFFLWSNIQYDFWYKALHSLAVYVRVWTCVSDQKGAWGQRALRLMRFFINPSVHNTTLTSDLVSNKFESDDISSSFSKSLMVFNGLFSSDNCASAVKYFSRF